jgi:uncharacterized protein YeaO (DUF488 family)
MLKSKSIHQLKSPDDGIRVCVMRRIKDYFVFDMWLQELSPSNELLDSYNKGLLDWDSYVRRFQVEVLDNPEKLPFLLTLKDLSSEGVVTLLCNEETDERCHRRLLIEKIEKLMKQDEHSQSQTSPQARGYSTVGLDLSVDKTESSRL